MLEKDNTEVSLKTQAALLGLSYSSLFYQPVGPTERELSIKRRIDEVYTAWPFYGSRHIAAFCYWMNSPNSEYVCLKRCNNL